MKILIAYDGSNCADAALVDLQRAGLPSDVGAIVLTADEQWPPLSTGYCRLLDDANESCFNASGD